MSLKDNVAQLKQLMDGAGTTDKCPMGRFTREKAERVLEYIMTRYQYTMPAVMESSQSLFSASIHSTALLFDAARSQPTCSPILIVTYILSDPLAILYVYVLHQ